MSPHDWRPGPSCSTPGCRSAGPMEQTAAMLHGTAKNTHPFLGRLQPATFARLLSTGETALGAALLPPVVPTAVSGCRPDGARRAGGLRPAHARHARGGLRLTQEGTALRRTPDARHRDRGFRRRRTHRRGRWRQHRPHQVAADGNEKRHRPERETTESIMRAIPFSFRRFNARSLLKRMSHHR
ncbi:hypothetical protein LV779_26475 [Streptomyces thinghirensis]|nr:hypothetical protein [Streptomyces thinghirensis]